MLFKFSTIKFAIAVFEKFKAQSTARRVLRGYDRLSQHRSMPPSGIGLIMDIKVECYAGYREEETPRRFWLGTRKVEIEDILDRWIAPDHRYFKVLGDDDARYILRYDTASWNWQLSYLEFPRAC